MENMTMKNMDVVSSQPEDDAMGDSFEDSIPFFEESLLCSSILCDSRMDDDDEDERRENKKSTFPRLWDICVRMSIIMSIVGIILVFVIDYCTNKYIELVYSIFLAWLEENPVGAVTLLTLLYFVATAFFVPAALLMFGAGFLLADAFGFGAGFAVGASCIFVASFMEAALSFLLGRYLLHGWVEGLSRKSVFFEAMVYAMDRKGLCIITLLRMIPFLPMNCVNYVAGTTRISFCKYCVGTILILPSILIYIFLGASASGLEGSIVNSYSGSTSSNATIPIIFWSMGIILSIVGIGLVRHYVSKELKYMLVLRRAEMEQMEAFT